MKKTFDTIIVGQGIAGTVLSYSLLKAGQSVLVIDTANDYSATKAAAGLINPITGRYYTKTWLIEELLPAAIATYQELERLLDCKLWYPADIYRVLHTITQVNDWESKVHKIGYKEYCESVHTQGDYEGFTTKGQGIALIKQGGRVAINTLVKKYKQYLIENNAYRDEQFDHKHLLVSKDKISYKDFTSESIVFAEGVGVLGNPYFREIPLQPAKGEALYLDINKMSINNQILKHRQYLVPIEETNTYWSGGGFQWQTMDGSPTPKFKESYREDLNNFIKSDYHIAKHVAGIRPCVKDRKPLIGRHRDHHNVYIFNGMGTKGTSLSPYFAEMLCGQILNNKQLIEEVDIARCYPTE